MTTAGAWTKPTGVQPVRMRIAGFTGAALGVIGRSLPGTIGPFVVAAGLWMAWRPLGVVFAGAVLWALDRRV